MPPRLLILLPLLLAASLAGCAQEVLSVHDSSLATQFSQLNKNGWSVNNNQTGQRKTDPNDPNVRVVKEANWSGLKFNTNFQVDDPALRAQLDQQNHPNQPDQPPPPAPSQPGSTLFGPAPK